MKYHLFLGHSIQEGIQENQGDPHLVCSIFHYHRVSKEAKDAQTVASFLPNQKHDKAIRVTEPKATTLRHE